MEIDRARVAALAAQATAANMAQGRLRGASAPSGDALAPTLDSLSVDELQRLRDEIDKRLPITVASLAEMNLPKELIEQYWRVKDLQDMVIHDGEIPLNQRSQLAGQVASTMQQLVKMQAEFYTAERLRNIENRLIKFMKTLPLEQAGEFLAEYEALSNE